MGLLPCSLLPHLQGDPVPRAVVCQGLGGGVTSSFFSPSCAHVGLLHVQRWALRMCTLHLALFDELEVISIHFINEMEQGWVSLGDTPWRKQVWAVAP